MDLKAVFDAEPKSTWQVLSDRGTGYYIPAYQRGYTWGDDKIDRLIIDSLHGLRSLVEKDDAITFIGTLIMIHDIKYQTVQPHVKGSLPGKVLLVIDGQQRLTTLLLLYTVLHEKLSRRLKDFASDNRAAFVWLSDTTRELVAHIDVTFREDNTTGQGVYKYYPRMIRAFVDIWSKSEQTAKYNSPIANCLHNYSKFILNAAGKFEHQVPNGLPPDETASHEFLAKNRKTIRSHLTKIAKGSFDDIEFPALEQIVNRENFQQTLFQSVFPTEVCKQLGKDAEGTQKDKDRFNELMRLVLFTKFLMSRVAVTFVTAKNEDYAFDMFEALNTTGEPLTAFETFRPKVIEAETLLHYENSPSQQSMRIVESFLDRYKGAQAKQSATTDLLIPFALAENGVKLPKRLSDQRSYLRDRFDKLATTPDKREFVRHLSHTSMFMSKLWPDEKDELPELEGGKFPNSNLTLLCLEALRAANHHVTIGLFSRFFSKYRVADAASVAAALKDFEEAILAVTAFFALWRGSRRSTANIDSYYRQILREGIEEAGVKAFARRPDAEDLEVPSAPQLKAAFRYILANNDGVKIATKKDWVDSAAQLDVYNQSRVLAKLLLYVATHDTALDAASPGLVKAGRVGSLNILTVERWRDDLTVEHIAPQSRNSVGWDKTLYDDADLVGTLGNLTLAPGPENASFGKRPWPDKRLMYRVLGTPSLDELDARLEDAKKVGIVFGNSTKEQILERAAYLPHVAAISEVTGEWSVPLVKARSVRLAELAWARLSKWLDIK